MGVILIIFAALLLLGALVLLILNMLRVRKFHNEKRPELQALDRANNRYASEVKSAEKALSQAERSYRKRVKQLQKQKEAAEIWGTKTVNSIKGKRGKFSFTRFEISVSSGTFKFDGTLTGRVDTAGNIYATSRSTLTRIATGGGAPRAARYAGWCHCA
ncbi:hypothetical protein [Trueperella sp. LYQ141]|uniref:hypothetical protein n=1 Tax=Trueperella sp. LYQ141 TaxID=3391058 RepID=UPI003983004F